jgi:hypothetical protein
MQLDKHPILWQGHEMMLSIEECGASEKLTHAVSLAGSLMDEVEKLVDENARLLKWKELGDHQVINLQQKFQEMQAERDRLMRSV